MVMQILAAIASDTVQSRCWVAVGTGHRQVEIQARPRRHAACKRPSRGRCLAHSPLDDGEPESFGASNTFFINALSRFKVSPFQYTPEELRSELNTERQTHIPRTLRQSSQDEYVSA
jgi:hypothetical protein